MTSTRHSSRKSFKVEDTFLQDGQTMKKLLL